jgi:SAM-dependent methyltransferase
VRHRDGAPRLREIGQAGASFEDRNPCHPDPLERVDEPPVRGDYDDYAPTYAWARSAVSWVLEPLVAEARQLAPGAVVVELGCGTGNYVRALRPMLPATVTIGLDISEPMLREALRHSHDLPLVRADASLAIPFADRSVDFSFAADVIHHLGDLEQFFAEVARVLSDAGSVVIVTDTPENIHRRSMPRYFPEVLEVEVRRLPGVASVHAAAAAAGLALRSDTTVAGALDLTDDFLAKLQARCSSALRLLDAAAHEAGMTRVRQARDLGERWHSSYSVFRYTRATNPNT